MEDESVTGVYEYDPPLDTVLPSGNHVLTCSFTPTDLYNYCPGTPVSHHFPSHIIDRLD